MIYSLDDIYESVTHGKVSIKTLIDTDPYYFEWLADCEFIEFTMDVLKYFDEKHPNYWAT